MRIESLRPADGLFGGLSLIRRIALWRWPSELSANPLDEVAVFGPDGAHVEVGHV